MAVQAGPAAAEAWEDFSAFGYENIRRVGQGQFARVHLVRHRETADLHVAKVVRLDCLGAHDQKLAQQEVELLRALSHPHIVGYRESFCAESSSDGPEAQRYLVITMEYCCGGDLRALLNGRGHAGPLPESCAMKWFGQLVSALHSIHRRRVLHRDLKASNIFLSGEPASVKLGDFGISRVLANTLDHANTQVGTPQSMAPEVFRQEPYGPKSDIWALGCVLFEMCSLRTPFESPTIIGVVYRVCTEDFDPLPGGAPQGVLPLLGRLLAKAPGDRPSAVELLSEEYVRRFHAPDAEIQAVSASPDEAPELVADASAFEHGLAKGGVVSPDTDDGDGDGDEALVEVLLLRLCLCAPSRAEEALASDTAVTDLLTAAVARGLVTTAEAAALLAAAGEGARARLERELRRILAGADAGFQPEN